MLTLRSATLVDIYTKPNGMFHSSKTIRLLHSSAMLRFCCAIGSVQRTMPLQVGLTHWTVVERVYHSERLRLPSRLPSSSHQYRNVWLRMNGEMLSVRGTRDQSRLRGIAVLPCFDCGGSYFRLGQKTTI